MFIKKDRRRIDEILVDPEDARDVLKLSKRSPEFDGSTRFLCRPVNLPALKNLRVLNLYDNNLTSLSGIEVLAETPIEEINLGCNKLTSLPLEFGALLTLQSVWLDDNEFEEFPTALCRLTSLTSLRIPGNSISYLPDLVSSLEMLQTLVLDNNELHTLPKGLFALKRLKQLWLRQNKLTELSTDIDTLRELEVLSVSSNQLTALPDSICDLPKLKKLYANGNKIAAFPSQLVYIHSLQDVNVANNQVSKLPVLWEMYWGQADVVSGLLTGGQEHVEKDKVNHKCVVNVVGNPFVTATD